MARHISEFIPLEEPLEQFAGPNGVIPTHIIKDVWVLGNDSPDTAAEWPYWCEWCDRAFAAIERTEMFLRKEQYDNG